MASHDGREGEASISMKRCEEVVKEATSLLSTYSSMLNMATNLRVALIMIGLTMAGLYIAHVSLIYHLDGPPIPLIVIFIILLVIYLLISVDILVHTLVARFEWVGRTVRWLYWSDVSKFVISVKTLKGMLTKREEVLTSCRDTLCKSSDNDLLCHDIGMLLTALAKLKGEEPPRNSSERAKRRST